MQLTPELLSLIVQGGAIVALYLWVRDLQAQRKEERDERLANAETMRTVGASLGELTKAIESLLDGERPRPQRERR